MILNFRFLNKVFVVRSAPKKLDPIGKIVDGVIHPDTFSFVAYWVSTPDGMRLLLQDDVLSWQHDIIRVRDEQCFLLPNEAVRLKPLLEREIPILKAKVFCNNQPLGKVVDFTFDTLSPKILQLDVRGGVLGFKKSLIHISQIYKTDAKGIHIFDNTKLKSFESPKEEGKGTSVDAVNCED